VFLKQLINPIIQHI